MTHGPRVDSRGWSGRRPALIVAHPGHELRVHGWLEATRPRVFVLTDGSGRAGVSRLEYTTRILARARAEPGAIYGRFTDRDLYKAILGGQSGLFQELAGELVAALTEGDFTDVAGDAAEGYNPAHDLCRLLINAAVDITRSGRGTRIGNFAVTLNHASGGAPDGRTALALRYDLDDAALARKLAAARAYAPLEAEVEAALATEGREAFRGEWLQPVDEPGGRYDLAELPPAYERHGAQRVAAGHYARVLRYREHMLPIADAIGAYVTSGAGPPGGR